VRKYTAVILVLILFVISGCGQNYNAEKQLWYANKLRNEKLRDP